MPPKIGILVFLKKKTVPCVEEALEHVPAIWIFNTRVFHLGIYCCQNQPLYENFSV
jgi:hypothetical protein